MKRAALHDLDIFIVASRNPQIPLSLSFTKLWNPLFLLLNVTYLGCWIVLPKGQLNIWIHACALFVVKFRQFLHLICAITTRRVSIFLVKILSLRILHECMAQHTCELYDRLAMFKSIYRITLCWKTKIVKIFSQCGKCTKQMSAWCLTSFRVGSCGIRDVHWSEGRKRSEFELNILIRKTKVNCIQVYETILVSTE